MFGRLYNKDRLNRVYDAFGIELDLEKIDHVYLHAELNVLTNIINQITHLLQYQKKMLLLMSIFTNRAQKLACATNKKLKVKLYFCKWLSM